MFVPCSLEHRPSGLWLATALLQWACHLPARQGSTLRAIACELKGVCLMLGCTIWLDGGGFTGGGLLLALWS